MSQPIPVLREPFWLPLWSLSFPGVEIACEPGTDGYPAYYEALSKLTEEEAPGIGMYRDWLQQAPPFGLPGTPQCEVYWTWRQKCPPLPPQRCIRCKSTSLIMGGLWSSRLDDYEERLVCTDCGQMQGTWPLQEDD
jgi:hypothetical protein